MPSSPRTPTRRRKSSTTSVNLSVISSSPQGAGWFPKRGSISRRSSQYSIPSPLTPHRASCSDYGGDRRSLNEFGYAAESTTSCGVGNLADELAEAFHEDEEGENGEDLAEAVYDDIEQNHQGHLISDGCRTIPLTHGRSTSPLKKTPGSKNRHHLPPPRRQGSQCDDLDISDDDDRQASEGVSPALEARMVAIEGLARRGTIPNNDDLDNVVSRVIRCLKDLGSQSSIENGASRLITIHATLISQLSNQTRTVSILAHPLISPLLNPPDPDLVDDMLPLFASLLAELPIPTTQPLSSLHSLHASTTELTAILTYLSDTLHMTRQTTSLAARRLRSATELVADMRKEAEARDRAVRWLEMGNWEERIADRECARVCVDVLGGFEETCNTWRKRLVGDSEIGIA